MIVVNRLGFDPSIGPQVDAQLQHALQAMEDHGHQILSVSAFRVDSRTYEAWVVSRFEEPKEPGSDERHTTP